MKKIDFKALDLIELNGFLYETEETINNNDKKIILAVHGMSSNCFKKRDDIIASIANKNGIDYFCFNNRGSELVKYLKKIIDGKKVKELGGTSFEDVYESYYDIIGAINKLLELGYSKIYLQGHSLGCTKILYTYNKLINNDVIDAEKIKKIIKGIILLSIVDIPGNMKVYLKEDFQNICDIALEKLNNGKELEFMPENSFIHPISAKSFIRYAVDYKEIDFMNLKEKPDLPEINNINIPIFMRWGNVEELIIEDAKIYSNKINNLVKNDYKDINYIDGANHSYNRKEDVLGEQIIEFLKRNDTI